jgi:integrase
MKPAKRFAPPPRTGKRRKNGAGALSRHVEHGPDGSPIPYDFDEKKRPLWKYTVRIKLANGQPKCRNIAALDDDDARERAAVEIAKMHTEAEAVKQEAKASETRTVNDLCDHFLQVKSGDNSSTREPTVKGYEREFKRFIRKDQLGVLRVVDVTPEHVDAWVARHASAKAGKARTRQKRVNLLGSLFRLAVGDGWRGTSPVLRRHHVPVLPETVHKGKIKGDQRVAKPLSMDEIEQAVAKLDQDDNALHLMIRLTGKCGLRLREATHLRLEDLQEYDDGAVFFRVVNGRKCSCRDCRANGGVRLNKASEDRLAAVPPDLVDACRKHATTLRARFGARSWFFPVWRAKPRQRSRPGDLRVAAVVSGTFTAAAEAVGLHDRVFHDLRGSAKRWLLTKVEANPTAVDVMLGHRLPGITQEYVNYRENPVELYWDLFRKLRPAPALMKEAKTA